eukprot:scaffold11428_cov105-Isochrysis_galbana.AAC.12
MPSASLATSRKGSAVSRPAMRERWTEKSVSGSRPAQLAASKYSLNGIPAWAWRSASRSAEPCATIIPASMWACRPSPPPAPFVWYAVSGMHALSRGTGRGAPTRQSAAPSSASHQVMHISLRSRHSCPCSALSCASCSWASSCTSIVTTVLPPPMPSACSSSVASRMAASSQGATFGRGTKACSRKAMRPRAAWCSARSIPACVAADELRCSSNWQPPNRASLPRTKASVEDA